MQAKIRMSDFLTAMEIAADSFTRTPRGTKMELKVSFTTPSPGSTNLLSPDVVDQ